VLWACSIVKVSRAKVITIEPACNRILLSRQRILRLSGQLILVNWLKIVRMLGPEFPSDVVFVWFLPFFWRFGWVVVCAQPTPGSTV